MLQEVSKIESVKALTEKLETMPRDTLAYIQGAIDMAGMLEAAGDVEKEGKAS